MDKKVIVYGKPACGGCDLTKKWLEKNNIDYTYHDITANNEARQRVIDLGFAGLPVVETEEGAWCGFEPRKLERLK